MERGSSAVRKRTKAKKKPYFQSEQKKLKGITPRKKSFTKSHFEDNDSDSMESDVFLRDIKPNKKLAGIDERLKTLRTDLKSLLGDIKFEKNHNAPSNSKNTVASSDFCTDVKDNDGMEADISDIYDFDCSLSKTPLKISVPLDETVDLVDSETEIILNDSNTSLTSKSPTLLYSDPFVDELKTKPSFLQHQIEELIYKSYCLQNSELFCTTHKISSAEGTNYKTKQTKSTSARGKQKFKFKKSASGNASKKLPKESDVEIINLDGSLGNSKAGETFTICSGFDVSNYKWDDSFELDEASGFLSDVQILEEISKKYDEEGKSNAGMTSTQRVLEDANKKTPMRKCWECPVCFEASQGQEVVATQCGHVFCKKCLENHTSQISNSCPTCRSSLQDKPFITLFNF